MLVSCWKATSLTPFPPSLQILLKPFAIVYGVPPSYIYPPRSRNPNTSIAKLWPSVLRKIAVLLLRLPSSPIRTGTTKRHGGGGGGKTGGGGGGGICDWRFWKARHIGRRNPCVCSTARGYFFFLPPGALNRVDSHQREPYILDLGSCRVG